RHGAHPATPAHAPAAAPELLPLRTTRNREEHLGPAALPHGATLRSARRGPLSGTARPAGKLRRPDPPSTGAKLDLCRRGAAAPFAAQRSPPLHRGARIALRTLRLQRAKAAARRRQSAGWSRAPPLDAPVPAAGAGRPLHARRSAPRRHHAGGARLDAA